MKKKRKILTWKQLVKVGVSGSRSFEEKDLATAWLDKYLRLKYGGEAGLKNIVILTGDAIGVDQSINEWCNRRGVKHLAMHARWAEYTPMNPMAKNPAGQIRNQEIVDLCDEFIAFWNGWSPGTKGAIKKAKRKSDRTGMLVRVLGVNELRKEMGVRPPVKVFIPESVPQKKARKIAQWVRDAGWDETGYKKDKLPEVNLFKRKGKKLKKKRKVLDIRMHIDRRMPR